MKGTSDGSLMPGMNDDVHAGMRLALGLVVRSIEKYSVEAGVAELYAMAQAMDAQQLSPKGMRKLGDWLAGVHPTGLTD